MQYCGGRLTQTEVEALYDRFKKLDRSDACCRPPHRTARGKSCDEWPERRARRGHKGFLSASDFTSIPDLAVNPLATRLARFSTGVNYVSFADLISVFSDRADKQEKLRYMFRVHDMDGDGVISVDDLRLSIQARFEPRSCPQSSAASRAPNPVPSASRLAHPQLLGGSSLTEKQAVEAAERVVESVTGDKGTGITKEVRGDWCMSLPRVHGSRYEMANEELPLLAALREVLQRHRHLHDCGPNELDSLLLPLAALPMHRLSPRWSLTTTCRHNGSRILKLETASQVFWSATPTLGTAYWHVKHLPWGQGTVTSQGPTAGRARPS